MVEPGDVLVGRVGRPHGLHGEVTVHVLSDVADRFAPGAEVRTGGGALSVATSRPHRGGLLVRFEHVDDRDAAEDLRGTELWAPPLPAGDSDTYFAHELVGMVVLDRDGTDLGAVTAVIELPPAAAYDLLEVDGVRGRWLLPAVDDLAEVVEHDGADALRLTADAPADLAPPPVADP